MAADLDKNLRCSSAIAALQVQAISGLSKALAPALSGQFAGGSGPPSTSDLSCKPLGSARVVQPAAA